MINVSASYATFEKQVESALSVDIGSTVRVVIEKSRVLNQFPEIDLMVNPVGIFGQRVTLERVVQEGDRVEIYRALLLDPKEARRNRASSL